MQWPAKGLQERIPEPMSSTFRWVALLLTIASSSPPKPKRLVFDLHMTRQTGKDVALKEGNDRQPEFISQIRRLRGLSKTNETHSCTLKNYGDIQYHMLIEIGSPCQEEEEPQVFRVVPDTGSSDLWIPASNCTHCAGRRYDVLKSCSSQPLGSRINFKYGDGTTASGTALQDTVKIGDLQVLDQYLIQVDDMDATSLEQSDGILGLAHHYETRKKHEGLTFMSSLFREHPGMPEMFSFHLTGMDDTPSKIVFGDPDVDRHAKEPFTYGKAYYMSHTDLWLTSVYSIGFNRTGVERVFPTSQLLGAPALVDSGSSLIVLIPDVWDDLIADLKTHLVNCRISDTDGSLAMCNCPKDFSSIPSLVINLIDQDNSEWPLCMSASEYILKSVDPVTGNSTCVPAIQRGNRAQPVPLIFGMTFMRAFYTNFDLENHRIGFARSSLSDLPAGAQCNVHNTPEKDLWMATLVLVSLIVGFSVYLCCCGDIGACCGWPSCQATEPCYGYSNLEKADQIANGPPSPLLKIDEDIISLMAKGDSNGNGAARGLVPAADQVQTGTTQPASGYTGLPKHNVATQESRAVSGTGGSAQGGGDKSKAGGHDRAASSPEATGTNGAAKAGGAPPAAASASSGGSAGASGQSNGADRPTPQPASAAENRAEAPGAAAAAAPDSAAAQAENGGLSSDAAVPGDASEKGNADRRPAPQASVAEAPRGAAEAPPEAPGASSQEPT